MTHRRIGDVGTLVRQQLEVAVRDQCSRLPAFHDQPRDVRRHSVAAWARLPAGFLRQLDAAERAARGTAALPGDGPTFAGLEIATNVRVNGRDCLVPLAGSDRTAARETSRGALLARRGGGFRAAIDSTGRRCLVQCRVPRAALTRSDRSGQEMAARTQTLAEQLRSDVERAAELRTTVREVAAAVAAIGVRSMGQAALVAGPTESWLPRASFLAGGPLIVELHALWTDGDVDGPTHNRLHADLGARLMVAPPAHDLTLVATSAALARGLAWLVDAVITTDDAPSD